jgi:Peptidase M1 N-terminal domain
VKATKVVTFNSANELELGLATLVLASSGEELTPAETRVDAAAQRISLVFDEDLPAGAKATLRIGFGAALTDSMTGYYKSTWEKGIYALTQFEVRDMAPPCVYQIGVTCWPANSRWCHDRIIRLLSSFWSWYMLPI